MKETQTELSADPIQIGPATLQIDGYYVKEFKCSVREGLDEEPIFALGTGLHIQPSKVMLCPSPAVDLEIYVGQHLKDKLKFRVLVQIDSDDEVEGNPYAFSIKLVGYFSLVDIQPIEERNVLYYRNAVMLLYSAAREIIATTTSRGPFPAFILPTLTFDLTDKTWDSIIEAQDRAMELAAKKQPRQLTSATKKPSKKGTRPKGKSKNPRAK